MSMSELTQSLKKHRRQNNMLRQSRMSLEKGKFIGPYEIIDFLKEGSQSKIYLGKSQYLKEPVAIKAINKSHFQKNLDDLLLVTKQIETLKILKHRNIITLYEIYESRKHIYLITEYCQGKDLIEKIIRKKRFSEEEALLIFFQLLDAFTYMHKMNICHRNVRTEHILFDKNNRPKIVGFGYSSFYEKNKKIEGAFGSLCYACPEIIDEQPYNPELADVWSLGVILYVLICGYLPFSDEDDNKNKILISEGKIEFPKEISNKLKDLLRHMLDKDPNKRYNFQKVVKHPWIKPYSESFFSQGVNIYKTIFPVEEKILNILHEFNFDEKKVKEDLIKNKFNIGTGLYKQIVRKLMDMKMKNISDLFCPEFNEYRDNEKNWYEDGDKRYEEFIEKVAEKYNRKENFVNEFKEREDQIVEKLIALKEHKNEEKSGLKVIDEENDKEKEEENNGEDNEEKDLINNNNNIEIVYNDDQDQDVDLIQQFKEEQNKKSSSNNDLIDESSPNNEIQTSNIKIKSKSPDDKPLHLTNSSNSENLLLSNKLLISSKSKNPNKNYFKSISNPNVITSDSKSNLTSTNNNFRMTAIRKTNTKNYFDRGSLYDDFLKKNHPENVRKTMLKSRFGNLYENVGKSVVEDIKEKDESESEKEEKKEDEKKLKYSLSFDFDDDDEEDNKEESDDNVIDVIDGDGDEKLFNLLNNDDDEEMKELKRLYYGDNLKQSIKVLKKSILKKKSVKFKDDVDNKEKEKDKEKNKEIKRVGTNMSALSGLDMDKYEEKLKQYNKNLDIENDKEDDCNNNDCNNNEKINFNSQLYISIKEENDKDNKDNDNKKEVKEDIISFLKDKDYSKKIDLKKNDDNYDIKDINNLLHKNYFCVFHKDLPCKKLDIKEGNNSSESINRINEFFLEKKKKNPKFFRGLKNNKNKKINQNKKDESTQTNLIKKPNPKYQISRNFFKIISASTRKNSYASDSYNYMYNGNNQVNINKATNPIRLNYNKNQILNKNKQQELGQKKNTVKYFKKNNNLNINTENIKYNNYSYTQEKSPTFKNNYNEKIYYMDWTNNLNSDNQRNYDRIQNNETFMKTDINDEDDRFNDYSKTIPRQKNAFSSVKNIKNEVIVKRNEIIEKIQHCQNLLNTIMVDKKYGLNNNMKSNINNNKIMDNANRTQLTFNKNIPKISDFGLNLNNMNKSNNKIDNNYNNGINQVYKKNNMNIPNNPNMLNNKYTYKRANIKYLDKSNDIYSFDNVNRENNYNSIYNADKNYNYNYNKNFYTKQFPNKGLKNYLDSSEINVNNYSFDAPQKQLNSKIIKGEYNYPSYMTINTRKLTDNQIRKYRNNIINYDNIGNNVYKNKNKNINVNSQNQVNKKLKEY